ncbi:DnaJ domain-containing protein [Glonium stellatum]|uniref:DnaJ domain-containing protein n=1 Tax=Glonium stellatum TaxID=574774 RepID=A0A8E2EQ40_9PEZI|nr:DnaJ domain-containing protein [Glonium stellatum]
MPRKQKQEEEAGGDEFLNDEPPNTINPYEVLGLDKSATEDQVKAAYRKAALQHHPDKAKEEDKATAHTKFQEIAFAYAILSDTRRRTRYDVTGRTEDSVHLEDDDDFDWISFYRTQFADVITSETISAFKAEYQGSEEEKAALLAAYDAHQGDLNRIYQVVMLSSPLDDEDRFRAILDAAIAAGDVPPHKKYVEESERSRKARMDRARKEARQAEKQLEKMEAEAETKGKKTKAGGGMGDLAALIQQRQKARGGNFFADLEAKYAPKKGRKRSAPEDEPPEEAFQRNAVRGKKAKAAKAAGDAEEEPAGRSRRSKRVRK